MEALYAPLVLWAMPHWQKPGHRSHLALATTVLWNRCCVVVLSVVCQGRAMPLLWQTLDHPSASVNAEVVIALLQRAERLRADCGAIIVLADRGFLSAELLRWFEGRQHWHDVMRLRGECRGFRGVWLRADGSQTMNLLLAHPTGLPLQEPWDLISSAEAWLDLVWSDAQRFGCEQLFRDQKSGLFQLASSGLRQPERSDRLLLVVAIAVLAGSLQGYALSLAGLRRQVDPHWTLGMSFLRIGLAALQMIVADAAARLVARLPIPRRTLAPCIPSRRARRQREQVCFSRVELPPRPAAHPTPPLPAVA